MFCMSKEFKTIDGILCNILSLKKFTATTGKVQTWDGASLLRLIISVGRRANCCFGGQGNTVQSDFNEDYSEDCAAVMIKRTTVTNVWLREHAPCCLERDWTMDQKRMH